MIFKRRERIAQYLNAHHTCLSGKTDALLNRHPQQIRCDPAKRLSAHPMVIEGRVEYMGAQSETNYFEYLFISENYLLFLVT